MNQMTRNYQMQRGCTASCPQTSPSGSMPASAFPLSSEGRVMNRPCACDSAYESMSQAQLFNLINEVSFAAYDAMLYLDTHPCDSSALSYHQKMTRQRKEAMSVFARRFYPLTADCTVEADSTRWEWVSQPWPWEPMTKGGCR